MKTSYREINKDKYDVYLVDETDGSEKLIGYVYRDYSKGIKWGIYCYFNPLLADYNDLNLWHSDSVEAGRVLVRAYNRLKNAEGNEETKPYNMKDLFGITF